VIFDPASWDWRAVAIGSATIAVALLAPKITQKVPSTILGVLAGVLTYFVLAIDAPEPGCCRQCADRRPVDISPAEAYFASITGRWKEIGDLRLGQIAALFGSALTLAVLLSIDTLKTCVVLDQLTRTRHDPNRELCAQGMANVASRRRRHPRRRHHGRHPGQSDQRRQTRATGVLEGLFTLVASLILGSFIAWIPVAALAGMLIVIGIRMIDREPLRFIESRATVFDFAVVAAVVVVALTIGLIAASAVGVAMAIILFVREQIGGSVVRHKVYVNQMSSTWHRPEAEMRVLAQKGDQAVIFELQGSLFFGTTQQLYADLEVELRSRQYVILDLKRVQSVDVTAAHMLNQMRDALAERGALLLLSNLRENLPNGRNLREFLTQTGLMDNEATVLETIYVRGQPGDEIFWIRRGAVFIFAPMGAGRTRHVAAFGRGDFFGGLAFLDGQPRGNDAIANSDTEVYVLSREQFNQIAESHKKLANTLILAMARTLALRLRHADSELAMLQEY
jgi:SulP family sulfate permease